MRQDKSIKCSVVHQHAGLFPVYGIQKCSDVRVRNPVLFIATHGSQAQRFEARVTDIRLGGKFL